ncbi:MAG: enoyl-CoA hydratase/isomerase family protein [Rhizobiales bacterium]|uniref:enoyl-CoA hydratase/isomerase family protein n=1 Tax=Xanthobacter flavus TaxID=281 RepID=UPI001ACDEAAC|nr:enoyl-CoA hydratase/isomerase family protein [Hyphomicrobiales bacterium]
MAVHIDWRDDVAIMVIDRVEARNALNAGVIADIGRALDTVAASDASALVIVGAGDRAFCAGADIKEIEGRTREEQHRAVLLGQSTFAKLDHLPMPSIAVIRGFALGGGLELAMACTFRIALPDAKLGLPEIKLGLIPGYGGTQRLPRLVGSARAAELILSGRTIDATEAERIGLVQAVVEGDDATAAGLTFAARFTAYSRGAGLLARQAIEAASTLPLAAGLDAEADLLVEAFVSADAREGIAAFREKRAPQFNRRPAHA